MAHVVDRDMLDVIAEGKRLRVWILDIDAPEQAQPYGHRSRQSLIALCGGESAQFDGNKQDRNGRLLARVRCNGIDAGAEQVRRGMAWVFVRYAPPIPHCMRSNRKPEARSVAYGLRFSRYHLGSGAASASPRRGTRAVLTQAPLIARRRDTCP